MSRIPQDFAFWVCHNEGGICLHDIGLTVKTRLARTAAADDEDIEISSVFFAVKTYADLLREQPVLLWRFLHIFPVYSLRIPPLRGAMLRAPAIVLLHAKINADTPCVNQ